MTTDEATKLEKEIIERSIDANGAVNMSGVVMSFGEDMRTLCNISRVLNFADNWKVQHEAIINYIDAINGILRWKGNV